MKLQSIAISDNGFIFNPMTGESFNTNIIGQQIIGMIKEGKSQEEMVDILEREYLSDRSSIEKDLQEFVSMLLQFQILEI